MRVQDKLMITSKKKKNINCQWQYRTDRKDLRGWSYGKE